MIVAYDRTRGIGKDNDLLWTRDMPADLRHFKDLTTGHAIIMGRKTYESIGRPLPNRQNIVISHQDIEIEGVEVVKDLNSAYAIATSDSYVIGGGQIYQLALDSTDVIYATEIDGEFNADTHFNELGDGWIGIAREAHSADEQNKYNYTFVTYARVG
jgi:dihydrofolate reductase